MRETETQTGQSAKNERIAFDDNIMFFFLDILVSTLFEFYEKHLLQ